MAKTDKFPHIKLRLAADGIAQAPSYGSRKKNPKTEENSANRQGHGKKLKDAASSIVSDWQELKEEREEEEKPSLPDARRIILEIDPNAFEPEGLKAYGIEVISELEDGYIIGASADVELSDLQKKIEKFIQNEHGGNKVAEIWEIIDGINKPEYILSDELWKNWERVNDTQIYKIDVGIACVGLQSQLSNDPKRKNYSDDEKYQKAINNWINKREQSYQEWDDLKSEREEELIKFVEYYQGKFVLPMIDGTIPSAAQLPDSFSCRISISGKGLKDLVFNFPYIFDVSEPDEFAELLYPEGLSTDSDPVFVLEPPKLDAPKVCVIDSGIQERHPLLKAAIDSQNSQSWVPKETNRTADLVSNGGHGTKVAGAVIYPRNIPRSGKESAICWIQNARVLNDKCKLPSELFPPDLLGIIVEFYHKEKGTRIFNHSIAAATPCRTRCMSAWASAIDILTWNNDLLFVVAAGNLPSDGRIGTTRLSVKEHLSKGSYPDYLLEKSSRIANPAQSFQALTVGSVALNYYHSPPLKSISQKDRPSAFSCSGLGIWETIKPEVVEYGGDLVENGSIPPDITHPQEVCPELVRSTLNGGPAVASDKVGTSFAAPKVSHIAACIAAELPEESCLLYRALIVQSARWPEWTMADNVDKLHVIRQIGYGIPDRDRAVTNAPHRITLITSGERNIRARQAHVYQVKLPEQLLSPAEEMDILLEVTLSYKAQPRRTRRHKRKYLSTWLDWDCSKKGEDSESFLNRILKEYDAPEDADKGERPFRWTLGKQKNHGEIKDVSRSAGTIQKDWTVVKSYNLKEAFCIAVVGHEGWNNDPNAFVPYSLVVSFEAIENKISIYSAFVEAQVEVEVEEKVEV